MAYIVTFKVKVDEQSEDEESDISEDVEDVEFLIVAEAIRILDEALGNDDEMEYVVSVERVIEKTD